MQKFVARLLYFLLNINNKHPVYINVSCQTRIILDIEKLMLHEDFVNHLLPHLEVFDQLHYLLDNFLLFQAAHILFRKMNMKKLIRIEFNKTLNNKLDFGSSEISFIHQSFAKAPFLFFSDPNVEHILT